MNLKQARSLCSCGHDRNRRAAYSGVNRTSCADCGCAEFTIVGPPNVLQDFGSEHLGWTGADQIVEGQGVQS